MVNEKLYQSKQKTNRHFWNKSDQEQLQNSKSIYTHAAQTLASSTYLFPSALLLRTLVVAEYWYFSRKEDSQFAHTLGVMQQVRIASSAPILLCSTTACQGMNDAAAPPPLPFPTALPSCIHDSGNNRVKKAVPQNST